MTEFRAILVENKFALLFLAKFIGLYLLLNTLYGFYVSFFVPAADPFTLLVSKNTAQLLSIFHDHVDMIQSEISAYVGIVKDGAIVINVFEGCNSVNVWIVFFVFVVAFSRVWYKEWKFVLLGSFIIYFINLLRVTMLFWVSFYFPDSLYFFHKFLFTGIIYSVVFMLWFLWVKRINKREHASSTADGN